MFVFMFVFISTHNICHRLDNAIVRFLCNNYYQLRNCYTQIDTHYDFDFDFIFNIFVDFFIIMLCMSIYIYMMKEYMYIDMDIDMEIMLILIFIIIVPVKVMHSCRCQFVFQFRYYVSSICDLLLLKSRADGRLCYVKLCYYYYILYLYF